MKVYILYQSCASEMLPHLGHIVDSNTFQIVYLISNSVMDALFLNEWPDLVQYTSLGVVWMLLKKLPHQSKTKNWPTHTLKEDFDLGSWGRQWEEHLC